MGCLNKECPNFNRPQNACKLSDCLIKTHADGDIASANVQLTLPRRFSRLDKSYAGLQDAAAEWGCEFSNDALRQIGEEFRKAEAEYENL